MGSIPESDMKSENYPYSFYEIYQSRQTEFLMTYPSDDLFEINRIIPLLISMGGIPMEKDRGYQSTRYTCEWIFVLQRITTQSPCR